MRTFALLQEDILWNIIVAEEPPQWRESVFIDITDIDPRPKIGWYWNGRSFELPETYERKQERQRILQTRRDVIAVQLRDIDTLSLRSVRSITVGAATDTDHARLAELDARATKLRQELAELT